MVDAASVDDWAADMPSWDQVYSPVTSRGGLRDLATLVALPATWVDQDPADIAAGLLGVLFGMLDPECSYVRFNNPIGGPSLECWRPEGPRAPIEFEPVLVDVPSPMSGCVTVPVASGTGDGILRITSISSALPFPEGLLLVGSRHRDFPTDLECSLLQIAVGLAAVSIHTARRLSDERAARIAAETALQRRDTFLATLAQDLELQLTTAERIAPPRERVPTADEPLTPPTDGRALGAIERLTRREAEVLGLLAQGLSNKEIGAALRLSERTIERHITGLYGKLRVSRRSQATAFAIREGLVDIEGDPGMRDFPQPEWELPV